MTRHTRAAARTDSHGSDATGRASRREFLQATAGAGALAAGLGSGAVGSGAAAGIQTPWLSVDGNLVRDPDGNKVILRGVNVVDPARAAEEWRMSIEPLIDLATDAEAGWHSHVIRLPMQPQDIGGHNPGTAAPTPGFSEGQLESYLADHVDPAVDAAEAAGAYIMLDYHRHYPEGPDWDSAALDEEIRLFWNHVAPRYSDRSHVLYELYNEPNTPYPGADNPNAGIGVTDPESEENYRYWRETAQPWVDLIRSHAPRNVVVIGSPRWSQFTYWADEYPFDGDNLAYAGHVYAHEHLRPLSRYFGKPAESVPVFMSEFGYGTEGAPYLVGTNEQEGQQFLEFFDEYDVHWQAWSFDHTWSPAMLNRDYEVASPHGRLFKDRLRVMRDADVPGTASGGGLDATAPAAPTGLTSPAQTTDSVDLTWNPSTDAGGSGLARYTVSVDGEPAQQVPAETTSATVSGLSAGTSYTISVVAIDGAGNESTAATVTATTDPAAGDGSAGSSGGDSGSGSSGSGGDGDSGSGGWWGSGSSDGSGSDGGSGSGWW